MTALKGIDAATAPSYGSGGLCSGCATRIGEGRRRGAGPVDSGPEPPGAGTGTVRGQDIVRSKASVDGTECLRSAADGQYRAGTCIRKCDVAGRSVEGHVE